MQRQLRGLPQPRHAVPLVELHPVVQGECSQRVELPLHIEEHASPLAVRRRGVGRLQLVPHKELCRLTLLRCFYC